MKEPLSADEEAEARELAAALTELAGEELLQMARVLVAAWPAELFGQTEVKVRDLAHRIAAKAYQRRLGQKKS